MFLLPIRILPTFREFPMLALVGSHLTFSKDATTGRRMPPNAPRDPIRCKEPLLEGSSHARITWHQLIIFNFCRGDVQSYCKEKSFTLSKHSCLKPALVTDVPRYIWFNAEGMNCLVMTLSTKFQQLHTRYTRFSKTVLHCRCSGGFSRKPPTGSASNLVCNHRKASQVKSSYGMFTVTPTCRDLALYVWLDAEIQHLSNQHLCLN